MSHKNKLERLAKERGVSPETMVQAAYIHLGRQKEVAAHFGITPSTLRYFLMAHNLEERTVVIHQNEDAQVELTEKARAERVS